MSSNAFILAGLGNPGSKYSGTRHNVGFEVVEEFARQNGVELSLQKWESVYVKIKLDNCVIYLLKPMTYMNLSGKSVSRFVDFFKIPPKNLMVVHDDLDMNCGRLKLVHGGGAGGHNGIRSITSCLGRPDFFRLKVGIGRPGNGDAPAAMPVDRFVLTSFSHDEAEHIRKRMKEVTEGVNMFFREGPSRAMNFINSFK